MNPSIEMAQARRIRDQVCRRFVVKPSALVGQNPKAPRAAFAQLALVQELDARGWTAAMIASYVGASELDGWVKGLLRGDARDAA